MAATDPVSDAIGRGYARSRRTDPRLTARIHAALGADARVEPVLVPADCEDLFLGAVWARPELLLDADLRAGMSVLAQMDSEAERAGAERLAADLASGAWDERHGALRPQPEHDTGLRLVVAGG